MSVVAKTGSAASTYQILAKLATGGMAELFLARGRGVGGVERYVVLKRILRHHASDAQFVRMFLEEARLARELYGRPGAMLAEMGVALARSGRSAEAREHLAELERLDRTVPVAYALSILYAGLGETDRALQALERAAVQRASDLSFLGTDPLFDPLRADPRFAALRARLRGPREEAGASEAAAP